MGTEQKSILIIYDDNTHDIEKHTNNLLSFLDADVAEYTNIINDQYSHVIWQNVLNNMASKSINQKYTFVVHSNCVMWSRTQKNIMKKNMDLIDNFVFINEPIKKSFCGMFSIKSNKSILKNEQFTCQLQKNILYNENSDMSLTKLDKMFNSKELIFYSDEIKENMLNDIYQNLDNFVSLISKYKNILLICGDYPGYGGAATNCNNLQNFLNDKKFNTYAVYYNYASEKQIYYNSTENYKCVLEKRLCSELKHLNFSPDLIILKSVVNADLTSIFNCPIYYLIGGIYKNELDKYHYTLKTKEENNKYINMNVLNQIKRVTMSFCNSSHTRNILKKYYGINTYLCFTSFVSFYKKPVFQDPDFENRKYNYGLIVSNFDRKIKNVIESITFLKDKTNVILIGKHSNKYAEQYGFESVNLVDNEKMESYYRQIKYVVQNSYYESCSNVKVESYYNGCKTVPIIVISSTQYAGYGGAATNAYELIKFFRKHNYKVCGVFFNDNLDVDYDPENIGGVYLYKCKYNKNTVLNDVMNYLNAHPTICLAKNYMAPQYCKQIFNCYTVYLVSGINHFRLFYPLKSATEILDENFIINNKFEAEITTNKLVDKIILNSELTKQIFVKIYPQFQHKIANRIVDTTFAMQKHPLTIKSFDIIVACSILTRKDKNNLFLINVLNDERLNKYTKIIIGSDNKLFTSIPNSTVLDIQSHYNSIDFLNRSKILLFPSLFDSNSNTVREAALHNCMPIITRNIGFNELFPSYLVCDTFTEEEWVNKIIHVIENYDEIVSNNNIFANNNSIDMNVMLSQ